jgi:hypothetical protein
MNSIPNIKKTVSGDTSRIIFSDVHSDEPHEHGASLTSTTSLPTHHNTHEKKPTPVKSASEVTPSTHSRIDVEDGTIVRDKRRHKISLGTSIKNAFEEWMGTTQEKISNAQQKITEITAQKEKMTIAPVETRKDMIMKASTHATFAPKDDHGVVIEKIRTYKKDVDHVTKQPVIVDETSHIAPSWKHFVEPDEIKKIDDENNITSDLRHETIAPQIAQTIRTQSHTKPYIAPIQNELKEKALLRTSHAQQNNNAHNVTPIITQSPKKIITAPSLTENTITPASSILISTPTPITTSSPVSQMVSTLHQTPPKQLIQDASVSQIKKTIPEAISTEIRSAPTSTQSSTSTVRSETYSLPQKHVMRETPPSIKNKPPVKEEVVSQKTSVSHTENTSIPPTYGISVSKIIIRFCVSIIIIIIGISLAVFVKNKKATTSPLYNISPTPTPTTSLPQSSLIQADVVESITLNESPSEFLKTLYKNITVSSSDITRMYPTRTTSSTSHPVPSAEFLTYIQAHLSSYSQEMLNPEFVIGGIRTTETVPFIIFTTSNFDRFFVDMLTWETHMQADFAPLFGTTVSTSTQFTDSVKNNLPVRILYDERNNEVMLYTFITKNTVLITATSDALEKLISRF